MGGYLWSHVLSGGGWVILPPDPFGGWGGYVQGMSIFPRGRYVHGCGSMSGVSTHPWTWNLKGEGWVLILPGNGT